MATLRFRVADATVGQPLMVKLDVDVRKPTAVDGIEVGLRGVEKRGWRTQELLATSCFVAGAATLSTGLNELECAFPLAADLPPSMTGQLVTVEYTLFARAHIPWWPDPRETHVVAIEAAPRSAPLALPRVASSLAGADAPVVELSANRTTVHPGDEIRGAFAVSGFVAGSLDWFTLSVVERESRDGATAERVCSRFAVPLGSIVDGKSQAFSVRLPTALWTSHTAQHWSRSTYLRAEARRFDQHIAADLELEVLAVRPQPGARVQVAPPALGAPRVQAAWAKAVEGTALAFDGERIRGARGTAELEVRRVLSPTRAMRLEATVSYPPLDMELRIQPTRLVGALGGKRVGSPLWDGRHFIACRDDAQWGVMRKHAGDQLAGFSRVVMDDSHIRLDAPDVGANAKELRRFLDQLDELCVAIARARNALPPPAIIDRDTLAEWQAIAGGLELGTLQSAGMRVQGRFEEASVTMHIVWKRRDPIGTRLSYRGRFVIADEHHLDLGHEDEPLSSLPSRLPRIPARLLDQVSREANRVRIAAEEVTVEYPVPVIKSPAVMQTALPALSRLVRQLGQRRGAYR